MIIFIIVFGTYANFFMFRLMSWRILASAAITVWCGFAIGYLLATLLKLPHADRIAISVETGIQNTGIAIALLGFSLSPPSNDIATVVPVAASIVTPIPLTLVLIYQKVRAWLKKRRENRKLRESKLEHCQEGPKLCVSNSSSTTLIAQVNGVTPTNEYGSHLN